MVNSSTEDTHTPKDSKFFGKIGEGGFSVVKSSNHSFICRVVLGLQRALT